VVEDHKHCVVCGRAIEPDKFICSPACEEVMKRSQKQATRMRFIMIGMFVTLFVVLMVLSYVKGT
jgi:predicted nucleic acid-binding Zn ribbon protein